MNTNEFFKTDLKVEKNFLLQLDSYLKIFLNWLFNSG